MIKTITISKLDAARRQLETAVRLYFHEGDPVSIHTLVSAAYTVIRDVNKKKGGSPMSVKDRLLDLYVKPESKKNVRAKLNEAENFFKHADHDHASNIEFNSEQSEVLMLDAIQQYFKLTGDRPPIFGVFQRWYIVNNPNEFEKMPDDLKLLLAQSAPKAISIGKTRFFEFFLSHLMAQGT